MSKNCRLLLAEGMKGGTCSFYALCCRTLPAPQPHAPQPATAAAAAVTVHGLIAQLLPPDSGGPAGAARARGSCQKPRRGRSLQPLPGPPLRAADLGAAAALPSAGQGPPRRSPSQGARPLRGRRALQTATAVGALEITEGQGAAGSFRQRPGLRRRQPWASPHPVR